MSQDIDVDSETELVAAKILCGKQSIIIGATYRPPRTKQAYMDSLIKHIEDICTSNPGAPTWIAGDVNLPDINWSTDQVITHQYPKVINESFLQMLAHTG